MADPAAAATPGAGVDLAAEVAALEAHMAAIATVLSGTAGFQSFQNPFMVRTGQRAHTRQPRRTVASAAQLQSRTAPR